jgi:outer membrane protein assembly factor BamC
MLSPGAGLLAATVLLGGCGSLAGLFSTDPQEEQYQKAAALPPLEVPPDLTLNADSSALRVPGVDDGSAVAAASPSGLAPPEAAADAGRGGARLRRSEDGTLRIEMTDEFARAWREIGVALEAAEIPIEDRDRSRGLYFVDYPVTAERQRGFTSMLAFWRDSTVTRDERFLVLVQAAGQRTNVMVFDRNEQLATSVVASEILTKIHSQLAQ